MGRLKALSLALVLALMATSLAACGGEESADLLPGETASQINANLNLIEELVAAGDCVGASNAAGAVSEQVEALSGVDPELKEALAKGAARLSEVVTQCDEAAEEDEETIPTETDEGEVEAEDREREREERDAEKEQKKEEKAVEKEEKETPSTEPPGQEKQEEKETPPVEPPTDGGTPSGGVSPGAVAGEE